MYKRILEAQMSETTRKILNDYNPTAQQEKLGDAVAYAPVAFSYDQTAAANAAAQTMFTAPFAMRITDVLVEGKNAEAAVVTVRKNTDAICTAITAADGALIHMTAGVVAARLVLAAGDIVTMQTGNAASLSRVTVIGIRI
jgi:hypothetical protein